MVSDLLFKNLVLTITSINNPDFENYLGQMYPAELEIKDTTESNTSASYLDLLLSIESDGQLRTSLYDKPFEFRTSLGTSILLLYIVYYLYTILKERTCVFLITIPFSEGTIHFEHMTLTVTFDLHLENFLKTLIVHNFYTFLYARLQTGRIMVW